MCHLCGHIMDWLLKLYVFSSSLILKVTHFFLSPKVKNKLVNYKINTTYTFSWTQTCEASDISLAVFLIVYLVTLAGNLLIMTTISASTALGSPVYFFLSHLSFIDDCSSSSMIPKMVVDSLTMRKTISFGGQDSNLCWPSFCCCRDYCSHGDGPWPLCGHL